jgi:YVTN family beta-propeller protein
LGLQNQNLTILFFNNTNSELMKRTFLNLFSLALFSLVLASCNEDHGDDQVELDIQYPAAFVVNGGSNNLDVINLKDLSHGDHIGLGGATFPHHIYLSPDKKRLAVAITSTDLSGGHGGHSGGNGSFKVLVINSLTGKIEKELSLPKLPHNAIFNGDGSELWVGQADELQSQVNVYATLDWSLKNTINVGKGLSEVTFAADGSKVFAANTGDATVSVINPITKAVLNTVAVGKDPVGAWPAANGFMYVDNETDKTVSELQVAAATVAQTISLGFKPGYVAYHAGNQELWVSDATNGRVVYYKKNNGQWAEQGNIPTGADAHAILFSNDGSAAYVTNQGAGTVSLIRVTDHTVTSTITVGKGPNGIAIRE